VNNPAQEKIRLKESRLGTAPWKKWGPYLSERQWGTVREDYSETGNAWDYFSHDQSRSRAYRWGEDGLAGFSDDKQHLCFCLGLWNTKDPILKERLFGLTNAEGNHGEDVKEYYFYVDSTPTHSYMEYLYKYPQKAYPYDLIVKRNKTATKAQMEFELLDTGIFDGNEYFDIFVRYAKAGPNDILIEITAANRGPNDAPLHVLPNLWFRNTWSWGDQTTKPLMKAESGAIEATHPELGTLTLHCEGAPDLLFTENETNRDRVFGVPNTNPFVKDGFHRYLVEAETSAVNPSQIGTKAAAHYVWNVPANGENKVRLRLTAVPSSDPFGRGYDQTITARKKEADEFYGSITPATVTADQALVMRQALAGMLWSKQYYYYDVNEWLRERGADPIRGTAGKAPRNREWYHMVNDDIISMPDKWEYPWYAAWDLAFHTIALAQVDIDFAKNQLDLMLRETYLHPNGQLPAYEWNFSDVNPPVHAWAIYFLMTLEQEQSGHYDFDYVEHAFQKLLMNFTWWVNRKDASGNNVFEGGFLGLDNIGVFDRSSPVPGGGVLEQADGTAWMAFYCICMLQIAIELAQKSPVYEDLACKFYEHFIWIASAMDRIGDQQDELWDEEDGFFYDVLRLPNGYAMRLKVRSLVGLLSLAATAVFPRKSLLNLQRFRERVKWFNRQRPELLANIANPEDPGPNDNFLLSVVNERKLRRLLHRLLDPEEFFSDYGIRSLSRCHKENPFTFTLGRDVYRVDYEPAESSTGMFGGNSNWRGPIWMPVNILFVRALHVLARHYGDSFKIECPTGSGEEMTLGEVAANLSRRLQSIFLRNEQGIRPVYGGSEIFQTDPHWRDLILFYEYFHGDNGAGIGASHQTGWTGVVARLIAFTGSASLQQLKTGRIPSILVSRD
jgi:hypothetical protein